MNYCTRNLDNCWLDGSSVRSRWGFTRRPTICSSFPFLNSRRPYYAVAVPTLSRLTGDPDRYRRYVLRILSTLAFVGMGLGAAMTLGRKRSDPLASGSGVETVGNDLTFFGPALASCSSTSPTAWIHLSLGRADRWFGWGVAEFIATAVLFGFGLRWGPIGIAGAWVLSFWLLTIPAVCYAGQPAHLRVAATVGAVWKYTLASALAGGASASSSRAYRSSPLGLLHRDSAPDRRDLYAVWHAVPPCRHLLHGGTAPLSQIAGLVRDVAARDHRAEVPRIPRGILNNEEHALVP